ncbi:hypothetical protein [Shouchella miscanthi]|uniref:Uncharacterized protein n=1 Tax=Shouchella miscanthi TaxID=2598861 RepID=A0ABU6NRA4_9BACI|nr:hypothetical protein [Shouchella miscanthi]MED4130254.1 hypothetical protein [Shouchella miscanthi]
MELVSYSYWKRNQIKAIFNRFPSSVVTFRMVRNYYFVYSVQWSEMDTMVIREDLKEMEWLLNEELGLVHFYKNRKRAY